MKFELVFHPGTESQERIPFTVSEGDLEDGLDFGRVESSATFEKQLCDCAYHKVLELNVCKNVERISGEPWVLLRAGKIIARNHLAARVRDEDLL